MYLITVLIILVILYLWSRRADPNLPPIPRIRLPLLGNLLSLGRHPRKVFRKWRSEYGDVFSVYIGNKLMIVISGYEAIHEALVQRADDFSHRPSMFVDQITGIPRKGVLGNSGPEWKEQRSAVLSILHAFSSGQNIIVKKIQEEVSFYLDLLASFEGKPTDIQVMTNMSVRNVMFSIISGRRFSYEDPTFKEMSALLRYNFQNGKTVVRQFPVLHYLPGDIFHSKKIESNVHRLLGMFKEKFMDKNRVEFREKTTDENLAAAYYLKRKEKIQAGQVTDMDDENLNKILLELFQTGIETASTPIMWCILYLLNHPHVQDKIYEEIKREIGTKRTPTIDDKPKFTYLNAVIRETLRLCCLVPLGVPHACPHDVTFRGYKIPKDVKIVFSLESVLLDRNIWGEDVMMFKPERFIGDDGQLQIPDEFVPFSLGRRACMGEALAKTELFLYLSSMFQRFKFMAPVADSPPPMDTGFGFLSTPVNYQVKVVERFTKN